MTFRSKAAGDAQGVDDGVEPAVAVEVADGHASTQDRAGEPGAGGRGGVDQPPLDVAEQGRPHGERLAEPRPVEDMAVGLEQVEPAVGVEVGQGHAETQDRAGRPGEAEGVGGVGE